MCAYLYTAGVLETSVYYRRDTRYDNILPTEKTSQISRSITLNHCCALCTQKPDCRTVFYMKNTCVLYSWNIHFYIITVAKMGMQCYEKSGKYFDNLKEDNKK